MLLPEKYNAQQKEIVCAALRVFNPDRFSDVVPENIDVTGIDAGNMSYGFKVHTQDGQDYFLKFSKATSSHQQLNTIMKVIDFAASQEDGLATATPISSGEKGVFVTEAPKGVGLPEELEGLTIGLQTFVDGKSTQDLPGNDVEAAKKMARQLAKFHKYSAQYYEEHPEEIRAGIPAESHKKLRPIEEVRAGLFEKFQIDGLGSFADVVKSLEVGESPFAAFTANNEEFIREKLVGMDGEIYNKDLPLDKLVNLYAEKHPEQAERIQFLDRLVGLNEDIAKGLNGRVGKMFQSYARLEPVYDRLYDLPRGITHNDVHRGNYMSGSGGEFALIDFDDVIYQGIPSSDLGGLIMNLAIETDSGMPILNTDTILSVVKPVLSAYDSERSLTEKETRDALLGTSAVWSGFFLEFISGVQNIKSHFDDPDLSIAPFNKRHELPPILDTISSMVEVASAPQHDLRQWMRDTRTESLSYLDLETRLPGHVMQEVKGIRDKISASTSPDSESKHPERSWVERSDVIGLTRTPQGHREI